ncbi:MAG: sigma-70 family RNA polymerase sigma factor [Patescibacteria group bacterium]
MATPENKKFAKIYDKHIDKIYRFIFLKTGTKEVAEDITSQVFTKGWRKFKLQGHSIENMSAYLFQIARAEVANHYREASKFQIISAESVEIQDQSIGVEASQSIQLDMSIIMTSLGGISEDYQNMLILKYVDGYSNKEIATILGKSEGAVRVMTHRALEALRDVFNNANGNVNKNSI